MSGLVLCFIGGLTLGVVASLRGWKLYQSTMLCVGVWLIATGVQ